MSLPVFGHGKYSVYVYYYPRDVNKDSQEWPCKIGFSRHSAIGRVQSQVMTSSPEKPLVALIVKSDDAYLLEQALHSILKLYHRQIKTATGDEWFMTSPETVLNLCRMLRVC